MLSKNNKILVGCLALLLAMSVGYALFSDTITVNGTATAKGNFDVTATCQTGLASNIKYIANQLRVAEDGGYQNDSCSVSGNVVSLNTELLYPGARRNYTVKLTNTGTIDAFYEASKATREDKLCVANNLEGNDLRCTDFYQEDKNAILLDYYTGQTRVYQLGIEDSNGNILNQSALLEFYDPTTGNLTLKPGYSAYIVYTIVVDHMYPETQAGVMNVQYSSSFALPFTQVTN